MPRHVCQTGHTPASADRGHPSRSGGGRADCRAAHKLPTARRSWAASQSEHIGLPVAPWAARRARGCRPAVSRARSTGSWPAHRPSTLWGTEGIKEGVRIGLGVGLVPRRSVRLELRHGVPAELAVSPAPEARTVTVDWTLARPLTAYQQMLLPVLREVTRAPDHDRSTPQGRGGGGAVKRRSPSQRRRSEQHEVIGRPCHDALPSVASGAPPREGHPPAAAGPAEPPPAAAPGIERRLERALQYGRGPPGAHLTRGGGPGGLRVPRADPPGGGQCAFRWVRRVALLLRSR